VVAHAYTLNTLTNRLDHAGAFVTEYSRQRPRPIARHRMEIGMAQAARREADQDLPAPRVGKVDLIDSERLSNCFENRRLYPHRRRRLQRTQHRARRYAGERMCVKRGARLTDLARASILGAQ
jgi:hypothetical protein